MISFKTLRESSEFSNPKLDKRLKFIFFATDSYCQFKFGKSLVCTGIFRTKLEQDETYKDNESYKLKPWDSVHQYWRGIDARSSIFTEEEIKDILEYVNSIVFYDNSHSTVICHNVDGIHLHFQTNNENVTILRNE